MIIILQEKTKMRDKQMDERKEGYSKLAVTGVSLAVVALIIVLALMVFIPRSPYFGNDVQLNLNLIFAGATCAVLLPCFGSVFSIIGLIITLVKKKKGKALAIFGIVINELEVIVIILLFLGVLLYFFGLGFIGY